MGKYKERTFLPADVARFAAPGYVPVAVVNDVTTFNWTSVDTTLTATRQDIPAGVGAQTTGTITYAGTDAQRAAACQVAIRALGGIYADATCTVGGAADVVITVMGGYNIVWTKTGGVGTIVETTPGKVTYTKQMPIGRFAEVKKIVLKNFNDNALNVSVKDADGKNVFVNTAVDTSTSEADTPYVKLLTAAGVAGEDGAAAANTSGGLFKGPLSVIIIANAPAEKDRASILKKLPRMTLTICRPSAEDVKFLERSTGAKTALSGNLSLGVPVGNLKRISLKASSDTTVAPSITDADGLVVYAKSSTDFTTEVKEQLSHEGVNQAGNAVADLLDVVAKSPLTIGGTLLTTGTFTVKVWVEA